jgi:subfamily B ATP-binding cassette protein MsbA
MSLESGRAALSRIYSFLDMDTSLPIAKNPIMKKTFNEEVVFEHVEFSYNVTDRQVAKDVSFVLKRGKTIAVVGSTGSGKTTLANLLARFYDPTGGRICMDGVELRDIEIGDLRKLIGVVTQETILFNTTIADNIAYGTPGATQDQIEAAAKMANAHPFILQHPDGYKRVVGDKGFVLSGGERQRVAIARAILKNPPILILDEATSALDTATEQQVQEAISHLMENRTVFVIAHRLSTIKHADLILVMDQGQIIESGNHDELYAKGGVYHGLCNVRK